VCPTRTNPRSKEKLVYQAKKGDTMPKSISAGGCLVLLLCAGAVGAQTEYTYDVLGRLHPVTAVGENQTAEVYICRPGQSVSGSTSYISLVVGVTNPSDLGCTQTFDVTSESPSRLHVLNITKGFGFITIGDDELELTDPCWKDPAQQRILLSVGYKVPPYTAERIAADPDQAKELIPKLLGDAIVEDGKTIDEGLNKADQWRCNTFEVE
jgi:hypothetical protein